MRSTHTLVIGGGQAGLAMSRCLHDRQLDHVVLERGRIGERWRSERWDSLRLLTPAWQSRLPGFRYDGPDPDGYLTAHEVTQLLDRYAASFSAPVEVDTTVLVVEQRDEHFVVETTRGAWRARNVVIATGHCDTPAIPAMAASLTADIAQISPTTYRRATDLPEGGVLVVGASASGAQIAEELHAAGRSVTLAVGAHTRLPRRYRGRDVMWWLDALGILREPVDRSAHPRTYRNKPSLQLVGRPSPDLDLAVLARQGVRLVGRAIDALGSRLRFARDLAQTTCAADAKLARLLDKIDVFAETWGLHRVIEPAARPAPFVPEASLETIDLRAERIGTIVWATGFRRRYRWLRVPVRDDDGEILHREGVTPVPGLYVLGLPFSRTRSSSFLDGVGRDAAALVENIAVPRGSHARTAA